MIAGRHALLAVVALAGLAAVGCGQAPRRDDGRWIAEATRRHALADQRLDVADRVGAREALRGIVDAPAPAGVPGGDRRGVLQDTFFRLAELDLDERDPRGALANAERGLALGRANDVFVANLLVMRGAAHEALGESPAAVEDYHQALVINDRLLSKALDEQGGAP